MQWSMTDPTVFLNIYFQELFVLDLCSYRCVCKADKGNFIISKFLTTMVISEQYLTEGNGYGLSTNDVPKICGFLGPLPLAGCSDLQCDQPLATSFTTGFSSEIRTKLREWAVGQAGGSCYSRAALSSNDSKTLYICLWAPTSPVLTLFMKCPLWG